MIRHLSRFAISAMLVIGLQGCGEKKQEASEQPVRGLRAYKVAATAESRVRRFPSVLQPADVSSLSFEIGGQLKAVTLTVGQKVQLGDVLAEIDPRSLQTPGRPGQRRRAAGPGAAGQRGGGFPAQGRTAEAGRRDAGRIRSVEGHSAQLAGRSSTRRAVSSSWQITTSIEASCWRRSPAPSPASRSNPLPRSPPGSRSSRCTATTASRCRFWRRRRRSRA